MHKCLTLAWMCCFTASTLAADPITPTGKVSVVVEKGHVQGRMLESQTETAVIRDYLQAWQTLGKAMSLNQQDLLDEAFVGTARDKLAGAIAEQAGSGLRTRYHDRSHDIQVLFYSPEGLSVQLVDNVEYEVELLDHDKVVGRQPVRARYIAVLSPSEVRWRVRMLQAAPSE